MDTYIARLRKTLGDGRLARRAPGYVLRVDAGELDLERFEDLYERGRLQLSEGDATAAAETLRSALALWRGNALADVIYEPFASVEAGRLEERRLSALEDRVDADLALAAAADVVAELEALVQEHPFRERLLGQLMLALYRSGRQAEALDALRRARHRLAEELGLEPGPELQELQRKILEHDQSLAMPPVDATAEDRPARRPTGWTRAAVGAAVAAVAVSAAIGIMLGTRDTNASPDAEGSNGLIALSTGSGDPSVNVDLDAAPAAVASLDGAVWLADASAGVRLPDRR